MRLKYSLNLLDEIQKLFTLMISGRGKYIDPSDVLNALVDD